MKKLVKILVVALCCVFFISVSACTPTYSPVISRSTDEIANVWVATPSLKVLADKSATYYSANKSDKVRIDAVRNEYESGQIILSAKEDISSFTVELSDLVKSDDSTKKISKSNFKVYTEMYIPVVSTSHGGGASAGLYPDALMPQDKAVENGINKIEMNKNGCAYLEFYIPKDAAAGLYTGEATITADDTAKKVPVEVKVYDYTLSDKTTSKSLCNITTDALTNLELDSSQYMFDKYVELLARSRLTPNSYVANYSSSQYCKKAIEYLKNGGSTINVRMIGVILDGHRTFDYQRLYSDIVEFAELSLRDDINYLDMCVMYNGMIDEPFFSNLQMGEVEYNIIRFDNLIEDIKRDLTLREDFQTQFGRELVESVDNVKHLITDYKIDKGNENLHRYSNANPPLKNMDGSLFYYDGKDVTLCPKFDGILSEQDLEDYHRLAEETGNEIWWYGANNPYAPYPSDHIDDTLPSSMLSSWMMAEYDIVGRLFWSINCWTNFGVKLDDPYQQANVNGANGEGVLCYPGLQYGIEGPVTSLRMESIREGNEDYEIIKDLQRMYAEKGKNFDTEFKTIRKNLYNLTKVTGTPLQFEQARCLLLECLEK